MVPGVLIVLYISYAGRKLIKEETFTSDEGADNEKERITHESMDMKHAISNYVCLNGYLCLSFFVIGLVLLIAFITARTVLFARKEIQMGDYPSHRLGTRLINVCPNCKKNHAAVEKRNGKWYCTSCNKVVDNSLVR